MDNIRKTIKLFFNGLDPNKILLDTKFSNEIRIAKEYALNKQTFKNLAYSHYTFNNNSLDEIVNLYRKVDEDWLYSPFKNNGIKSPFYLLSHFTSQVLSDEGKEPFVIYEHLLKWRDLTFEIGEDVLSTSHLAYCDVISHRKRHYLSWRPVLFSNNNRLKKILEQGVAENHSHLNAAGINFDISWIALMNKYGTLNIELNQILQQSRLKGNIIYEFNNEKVEFNVLLKKAVAIRLILFKLLNFYGGDKEVEESELGLFLDKELGFDFTLLFENSNSRDSFEFELSFEKILNSINYFGQLESLKLQHNGNLEFYDYAAINNMEAENFSGCYFLYGERFILYNSFKHLFERLESKKNAFYLEKFLHFYLLIKNAFRNEIIQLNKRPGFGNFKDYQDRKFTLIKNKSIYNTFFLDITLNYYRKLMSITSYELRFGPDEKVLNIYKNIEKVLRIRDYENTEKQWEKKLLGKSDSLKHLNEFEIKKLGSSEELFFVLHFFKKDDNRFNKKHLINKELLIRQNIESRDFYLREKIRKHAKAILKLREDYPEMAIKVKGIDAASSEIAARPESFAQAFRYLKNHTIKQRYESIKGHNNIKPLRITFHAGEDFFDIVDGMRYIDECISFLNMGHGDRLGHALAIGINVKNYYNLKNRKLMLNKHTILDNLVWLLSKAYEFGLVQHLKEMARLESLFKNLFSEIYLNSGINESIRHISYHDYFDAWKLRGDDPIVYFDFFNNNDFTNLNLENYFNKIVNLNYWERCRLNNFDYKLKQVRNRFEISRLYYEYHYNPSVKNIGFEIKQFDITEEYIHLVNDVQKGMMECIVKKDIAIETNPTSNFLIGTINRYADHPITKWFNLGLINDEQIINQSSQISVSINTDDAGIFATSLENEYAMLAIALEKEVDGNGNPRYKKTMIYDWLEKVRVMGLQQSFLS